MKRLTNKTSRSTNKTGKKRPVKQPVISAPLTCSDSVEEYKAASLPSHKDTSKANKGIPIEAILAYRDKNLSQSDIAALLGCDRTNITKRLKGYEQHVRGLDTYKQYRADALASLSRELLQSITPDLINKMPVRDRVLSFGIIYDKERLERGQSTGNIAIKDVASHYSNEINKLSQQRQAIMQQLGMSPDIDTSAHDS